MWMQPNADDSDATSGTQIERREQLTGKDHGRLALPPAICIPPLERIATMENDLGAAVWKHRLGVGHFARVSIERPDTFDDPRERRRGLKFLVSHRVLGPGH
jgi:hypothetical protein